MRHNCATVIDALTTLHTLADVEAFESTAKHEDERPPFTPEEQEAIWKRKRELAK